MKKLLIVYCMVLATLLAVSGASADTISYNLTTLNIGGFTGPYVNVEVNWTNSKTAVITFKSLTNGGFTYLLGDGSSVALNTNGTVDVTSIANLNLTYTIGGNNTKTPSYSFGNPGQVDGFGTFNFILDNVDGFTAAVTSVTFTLTNVSGTWASASDVLKAPTGGNLIAAHVYPWDGKSTDAASTGYADQATVVPEPATMFLLGSGLIGVATVIRRRVKK